MNLEQISAKDNGIAIIQRRDPAIKTAQDKRSSFEVELSAKKAPSKMRKTMRAINKYRDIKKVCIPLTLNNCVNNQPHQSVVPLFY
jgi:hypothetical protein